MTCQHEHTVSLSSINKRKCIACCAEIDWSLKSGQVSTLEKNKHLLKEEGLCTTNAETSAPQEEKYTMNWSAPSAVGLIRHM